MKLYEKIQRMTLEEMASEFMFISILCEAGNNNVIEFLNQDVKIENDLTVYDMSVVEDGYRGNTITIAYDCGDIGDGEYSLTFSDRKYDEETDMFKREILAFSNGMDSETDKSFLIRLLKDIADQAIVVE